MAVWVTRDRGHRVLTIAGRIYALAGTGTRGGGGIGGPATAAELNGPSGVAVDGASNLLFADQDSDRVQEVTGP